MAHSTQAPPSDSNSSSTADILSSTANATNAPPIDGTSHHHHHHNSSTSTMSAAESSNGAKTVGSSGRPESAGGLSSSGRKKSGGSRSDGRLDSAAKTVNGAPSTTANHPSSTNGEASGEVVRMTAVQTVSSGDGSGGSATATTTAAAAAATATSSNKGSEGAASPLSLGSTGSGKSSGVVPYPAPSVGLPTPAPTTYATSLLNLEVKVLTQALGAENQWVEQGDGRVSFCDFTIRVTAPKPGAEGGLKEKKASSRAADAAAEGGAAGGAATTANGSGEKPSMLSNTVSDLDEDDEDDIVILEDTISNDTPFVGENCCIVWNSFEKQLSLCLMYASEEGYSASWSALVALQDKSYPPFRYDLLERCRPVSERSVLAMADSESSSTPNPSPTDRADEPVLPYAYFIHERHNPPLGFIEQHALSLSIMEHHHATNPALYENRDTVVAMLSVANADLLDHLISEQVFPLLLSGLKCGSDASEWVVPAQLRDLHVPPDVTAAIAKDRRITFLQESVLPTCCNGETKTELMTKYSTLSRRIRNDIVCGLLTCDALFTEASEALRIVPPVMTGVGANGVGGGTTNGSGGNNSSSINNNIVGGGSAGTLARSRISSIDSSANTSSASLSSGASPLPAPLASNDTVAQAQRAEQQVLAHLRFFRELVTLSIAELGREMVGPIVGKVYQGGLLYSLSLVAERFAMPANMAAVFVKRLTDNGNGGLSAANRRGGPGAASGGSSTSTTPNGANFYSPAVEQELAAVLDATLVRINERQEEQLMNDHVRTPILADPLKYNGLVTFMVRQLIVNGTGSAAGAAAAAATRTAANGSILPQPKRIMRDSMSSSNPFALFHVLGLHDDEGSAASERVLDAESTTVRNQFHNFIITKYLAHATRGTMPPVPLPPSLGGVAARNTPIVRFDNAAAAQNGTSRGGHHDGIEASTSTPILGVPNTGVGVGAVSTSGHGGNTSGVNSNGVSANGSSSAPSPVLPLPQGVTPALIRVLEYLVALTSRANRELVLKTVFHPKSHILHFIEGACDTLCSTDGMGGRCQVGLDVLCGCVRFLKVVITQMALPAAEQDENPLPSYAAAPEPLSAAQITVICRQLTVERDTFGYLLRAYNKLGGVRRNTVFHSSLLAVLDIIGKYPAKEQEDKTSNNLRDVRDYLFYKHLTRLPEVFARRFREQLLDDVSARLGREATHSPNDSVSVLSSTAGSELLRSSSKLRFVDEVEAVAGGVDGTVVAGSVMNPAIITNMASAEERQRKRNARSTLDQWTATATHVMSSPSQVRAVAPLTLSDDNGAGRPPSGGTAGSAGSNSVISGSSGSSNGALSTSPPPPSIGARASPPMTISITRPSSTSAANPRGLPGDAAPGKPTSPATAAPGVAAATKEVRSASSPLPPPTSEASADAAAAELQAGANDTSSADTANNNNNNNDGGVNIVQNNVNSAEDGAAGASAKGSSPPSLNGTANNNGAGVLKPTAPKNEKPPGRPRNFASVIETSAKNSENGGSKSRSMPNVTTGALSPPSSPEETRLAKSGTITASAPLARANSSGESGATANAGSPSSPTDNVILPKIKKRVSTSGKRV